MSSRFRSFALELGVRGFVRAAIFSVILEAACPAADSVEFVRVDPDGFGFTLAGQVWRPFGCNYFDPRVGWAPKLWSRFDAARVERHFEVMEGLGVRVARVFLTAASFFPDGKELDQGALEKFDRLLAIARRRGILLHPSGPDHWEGTPDWRRGDLFADDAVLECQVRFWRLFAARYAAEPGIFAWDLLNEPHVAWSGASMESAWRGWLRDRYSDRAALKSAWGELPEANQGTEEAKIPPDEALPNSPILRDFQEFREDLATRWVRLQTEAIRSVDPNHLITVGCIQWSVPALQDRPSRHAGFRPARIAAYLDFLSIHFYPLDGDPLASPSDLARNLAYLRFALAYMKASSPAKPLVVGEFAWYGGGKPDHHPERTVEDQVLWCRAAVLEGRGFAAGWLNWAYADTPSSGDLTKYSGLVTVEDELKPWGRVFGELARAPERWDSRPKPPESCIILRVPWKASLTDPVQGTLAFRRYAERRREGQDPVLQLEP
jgi:hypothetical protein